MSVCEGDLLQLGMQLAAGSSEAQWRASVSRSYYAGYHAARAWHDNLPSPGSAKDGTGVHTTLINRLASPTVQGPTAMKSKALGYMLRHLKTFRTKADYELSCTFEQSEAQTVAQAAAQLVDKAS